jgi:hypothetical protein
MIGDLEVSHKIFSSEGLAGKGNMRTLMRDRQIFFTELQDNREGISSNPYVMFKFSTRSEITRKYYEGRIRHFLTLLNLICKIKTM